MEWDGEVVMEPALETDELSEEEDDEYRIVPTVKMIRANFEKSPSSPSSGNFSHFETSQRLKQQDEKRRVDRDKKSLCHHCGDEAATTELLEAEMQVARRRASLVGKDAAREANAMMRRRRRRRRPTSENKNIRNKHLPAPKVVVKPPATNHDLFEYVKFGLVLLVALLYVSSSKGDDSQQPPTIAPRPWFLG